MQPTQHQWTQPWKRPWLLSVTNGWWWSKNISEEAFCRARVCSRNDPGERETVSNMKKYIQKYTAVFHVSLWKVLLPECQKSFKPRKTRKWWLSLGKSPITCTADCIIWDILRNLPGIWLSRFPIVFETGVSTRETSFLLVWLPGRSCEFHGVYAYNKTDQKSSSPRPLKLCHATIRKLQVDTGEMITRIWKRGTSSVTTGTQILEQTAPKKSLTALITETGTLSPYQKERLILVEILSTFRAVIPIPDRWRLTAVQILADVCPSHLITEYEQIYCSKSMPPLSKNKENHFCASG